MRPSCAAARVALAALTALAALAAALPPPPPPPALACGIARLAAARADALVAGAGVPAAASRGARDALRLGELCARAEARPAPRRAARQVFAGRARWANVAHAAVADEAARAVYYVDAALGSDDGSGSLSSPFRTVQRGLDAAASGRGGGEVRLRAGVYRAADEPGGRGAALGARHSGITLRSAPGERATLSGAAPLGELAWRRAPVGRAGAPADADVWVARLGDRRTPRRFDALRVDGARATRARFPNCDPERTVPDARLPSAAAAAWAPPRAVGGASFVSVTKPRRDGATAGLFATHEVGVGGACGVYDPPASYWCAASPQGGLAAPFQTPAGLSANASALPNLPRYGAHEAPVFNVWRPARWANWMFEARVEGLEISDSNEAASATFNFTRGGFQGARGAPTGGDWFVENVLAELDAPNEFYLDTRTSELYLWYNGTGTFPGAPPPVGAVEAVVAPSLLRLEGTRAAPVANVTIAEIDFVHAAPTYLSAPHGVPSGGDWALERQAALFAEGTAGLTVEACNFSRLDGNALMLSGSHRAARVRRNEFGWLGGSAVALWGRAELLDGTGGEQPWDTRIEGNLFHEVGIHEKQSAFVFQALAGRSTIARNVAYNAPRAGINLNDPFSGGHRVEGNVIFNTCRESGDHGPINSWDRQPFLWQVPADSESGGGEASAPSLTPEVTTVEHNLLISNYQAQGNVDNDDGSAYYLTRSNVLFLGEVGLKSDWGGHDNAHVGNMHLWVGTCADSGPQGQLDGHQDAFVGNVCLLRPGGTYVADYALNCSAPPAMRIRLANNTLLAEHGTVEVCGMSLAAWRALGNDPGTTVARTPESFEALLDRAARLLGSSMTQWL